MPRAATAQRPGRSAYLRTCPHPHMLCPHCRHDLDDPSPECPECGFHIAQLDTELGEPPRRDGAVADNAGLLSEEARTRIHARTDALRDRTGAEVVLVTLPSTAPRLASEVVFWLFNRWQVGGESHRGVLILVAVEQRRIESEVGYDLEHVLTDEASQRILEKHAAPLLARGAVDDALVLAADLVADVIENGLGATES